MESDVASAWYSSRSSCAHSVSAVVAGVASVASAVDAASGTGSGSFNGKFCNDRSERSNRSSPALRGFSL